MLLRELPSVVVTLVTMIQQISQRRLYSPHFSGTVTRCACAFVNLLWSNVECDIVKGDHAPDCGVAQGVIHGVVIRHHGRNQEEVEEELEKR